MGAIENRREDSNIRERIARDVLPEIPQDAEPKTQDIILLLGCNKSQAEVAKLTDTSGHKVAQIVKMYRDDILRVKVKTGEVMKSVATRNVLQFQVILSSKLDKMTESAKTPTAQELKTVGGAVESVYRIAHLLSLQADAGDTHSSLSERTVSQRDKRAALAKLQALRADKAAMAPGKRTPQRNE